MPIEDKNPRPFMSRKASVIISGWLLRPSPLPQARLHKRPQETKGKEDAQGLQAERKQMQNGKGVGVPPEVRQYSGNMKPPPKRAGCPQGLLSLGDMGVPCRRLTAALRHAVPSPPEARPTCSPQCLSLGRPKRTLASCALLEPQHDIEFNCTADNKRDV